MVKMTEEPKNVVLEDLSLKDLKSLAYDELLIFERVQNNLRVLREEINKREEAGEK
jgi:hypothetical protein